MRSQLDDQHSLTEHTSRIFKSNPINLSWPLHTEADQGVEGAPSQRQCSVADYDETGQGRVLCYPLSDHRQI